MTYYALIGWLFDHHPNHRKDMTTRHPWASLDVLLARRFVGLWALTQPTPRDIRNLFLHYFKHYWYILGCRIWRRREHEAPSALLQGTRRG